MFFALLVLILVIASFVNVVAGTFMSESGFVMTRIEWIVFIGIYIAVASLVPVLFLRT